ncbi:MAG: plasmid replication protein, CyRepA1 family [Synechococcaceae cyanobacterium]
MCAGQAAGIAPPPPHLTLEHWLELVVESAIDPALAALNARSFGEGTTEHWEDARTELIRHKRLALQTSKLANNGHVQTQPGFVSEALTGLQRTYSHLRAGGWRSTTAGLPGFEAFDCWKPAQPRLGADRRVDKRTGLLRNVTPKPVKYETQLGHPRGGGLFAAHLTLEHWRRIAGRRRRPADANPAEFWDWVVANPPVPVLLTEGLKKALAGITAGWATLGLPGITMGWRTDENGRRRLIPELEAIAAEGRPIWLCFDREGKPETARKVARAARITARLLQAAGCRVKVVELPLLPGSNKAGLDDVLAAAGVDAIDRAIEAAKPPEPLPVLPRLRRADLLLDGRYLPIDVLQRAGRRRLIALAAAMGTGKSTAIARHLAPLLEAGQRVVLLTHRRSLGAALAAQLGLPWADEAAPGSDLRQTGIALCIDSLHGISRLRFRARDWAGAVVVIDEARQVLHHALNSQTAIAARRPAVLAELGELLHHAALVLAADAQLDDPTLAALEACVGEPAYLIASRHRPAAGRELVVHPDRESWRQELLSRVRRLEPGERLWIATTAQKHDQANSAQSVAALVLQERPDLEGRVLVVDSQTVADPDHDAHRLAADPDHLLESYAVVVATPAVQAGLSVTIPFSAVLGIAGGTTPPSGVAQAMARVRGDCPRHLYAPVRSPGRTLRVGCGGFEAGEVIRHLDRDCQALVGQLVAAGGWTPTSPTTGPWLALWAQLAAHQNREAEGYSATAVALLEREGYSVVRRDALDALAAAEAKVTTARLRDITTAAQTKADQAIREARLLTDAEATELQRRRRMNPADRAALSRWRIARAWGLGDAPPPQHLLEADRDGLGDRLRWRWLATAAEAEQLVQHHDLEVVHQLAPAGIAWAPDLAARTLSTKRQALITLDAAAWLARSEEFSADDHRLNDLHSRLSAVGNDCRQMLGISPGRKASTTLRRLLALVGAKLSSRRCKERGDDRDVIFYRVELEAMPDGISAERLLEAWVDGLRRPGRA